MDELAVADIDANVAKGSAHGVEKNQVTRDQIFLINILSCGCLLFSAARQYQTNGLFVNGFDETAAVKTRFRCVAAALVRDSQKPDRVDHELGCFQVDAVSNLLDLRQQAFVGQPIVQIVDDRRCSRACTEG